MTATLPTAVLFGEVKWRAVAAVADSNGDADADPDALPVTGTVTFTPSASVLLATGTIPPVTVFGSSVSYELDEFGVLRDATGRDGVSLLATDSPGITPIGWTWTVSYRLNGGLNRGSFAFSLPAGETVDLTQVAPVTTSGGTPIIQGPKGDPGSAYPMVIHGTNPNVARPDVDVPVVWYGSVDPVNADDALDVTVYVLEEGGEPSEPATIEERAIAAVGGVFIVHGDDANTARPSVATGTRVLWLGSVEPTNSDDTLDVWIPVTSGA